LQNLEVLQLALMCKLQNPVVSTDNQEKETPCGQSFKGL
jgi:hypothetical protein